MASVSSGLACKQKTSAFKSLSISELSRSFSIASLCLKTTIIAFVILVPQANNGVVFGQIGDSSIDNQRRQDDNRLLAYQVDSYDSIDDGRQRNQVTSLERLSPLMRSIDSANNHENQFAKIMRTDSNSFVVTQQPVSDSLMLQAPTFVVSPSSEMYATAAAPPSQQQQVHSIGNSQKRQQVIHLQQQPRHIMITGGPASQFSDNQQSRSHIISQLPLDVSTQQTVNDAYIGDISSQQPTAGQVFTMPSNKRSLQSLLFGSKSVGLMSKSRSQKLVGDVGKLVGLATATTTSALNSKQIATSDEQKTLGDIPISLVSIEEILSEQS